MCKLLSAAKKGKSHKGDVHTEIERLSSIVLLSIHKRYSSMNKNEKQFLCADSGVPCMFASHHEGIVGAEKKSCQSIKFSSSSALMDSMDCFTQCRSSISSRRGLGERPGGDIMS